MALRRLLMIPAGAVLALAACTAPAPEPSPTQTGPDASVADVPEDDFTAVIGDVLSLPAAVPTSDGTTHIAYELYLSNVTSQTATIQAIDVLDEGGQSLARLDGDAIIPWVRVSGATEPGRVIGPGQGAIVWIDVTVASMDALPANLTHDITFGFEPGALPVIEPVMTERIAPTPVSDREPVLISPPLEGANWLNGNSCCEVTPHRGAVNPINGALHAPERYGIDYVQLDESGTFIVGPVDELTSYPYFGANILAVADGPIVSMRWDLPEQKPGANPTGLTLDEYGGNHIVQQIGDGVYAFYAHLQPGNPLGVEVGQELTRGDVIALLGNTGNTDSPHLHFHLMDSPSPLGSNGVPFVYDAFELVGTVQADELYARMGAGGPFTLDTADAGAMERLYPIWLTVTSY